MIKHPVIDQAFQPTRLRSWQALLAHAKELVRIPLREVIASDKDRFKGFFASGPGVELDYSKQYATRETVKLLMLLADESQLAESIAALLAGSCVNVTEDRAAHHARLRGGDLHDSEVATVLARIRSYAAAVSDGRWRGYSGRPITDLVHIGIGGSYLGPELVCDALRAEFPKRPRCRFVANVDATALDEVLRRVSPETTVFHVVSKSFTTTETLHNAVRARAWYLERGGDPNAMGQHFMAVTSATAAAAEFGIPEQNVFPMWDWVGGRFSLWSAAGALTIAAALGVEPLAELFAGARSMDDHFESEAFSSNLPVLLALLGIWNTNFLGASTHVVIPYAHRLTKLPAYLQQLEMESNGKSVTLDGAASEVHTCPVVWGGVGTNGQHAFHQLLMQGTYRHGIDFILPMMDASDESNRWMLANCIGQSEALLRGHSLAQ